MYTAKRPFQTAVGHLDQEQHSCLINQLQLWPILPIVSLNTEPQKKTVVRVKVTNRGTNFVHRIATQLFNQLQLRPILPIVSLNTEPRKRPRCPGQAKQSRY